MPRLRLCDYFLIAVFGVPFISAPLHYRPFAEPKWIAFYLITFLAVLVGIFLSQSIRLPKINRVFWGGIALIFINLVLVLLVNTGSLVDSTIADRIGFLSLFVLSFNLAVTGPDWLKRIRFFGILSVGVFALWFLYRLVFTLSTSRELSLTFGQINMAAQFMAFSLPFVFVEMMERKKSKKAFALLGILAVILYAEIYFTACRSVWIGAFALFCYFCYLRITSLKQTAVIVGSVALLILGIQYGLHGGARSRNPAEPITAEGYFSEKLENRSYLIGTTGRSAAWKETFRMSIDHPLGVGADEFESAFLQYHSPDGIQLQEGMFWPAPHNEFLRILSEDGWAGLLFFLISAVALLVYLWKTTSDDRSKRALLIFTVLVWLPELMFQFPLAMANSFLPLALVLGALVASDEIQISRALPACALLFILLLGGSHIAATYFSERFPTDQDKMNLACKLNPSSWRNCVRAVQLDGAARDFDRAHAIADRFLARYPDHFPMLKAASMLSFAEGDRQGSCSYMTHYDQLFEAKSSMHSMVQRFCGSMP